MKTAEGNQKTFLQFLDTPTPHISTKYELGEVLGRGQFGTTRIAVDKNTGKKYACKSSSKRRMRHPDDIEDVKREIQVCSLEFHLASNVSNIRSVVHNTDGMEVPPLFGK